MNQPKFAVSRFENRNGSTSWRVDGRLHGVRFRRNFKTKEGAAAEKAALELKAVQAASGIRSATTFLTDVQLREAEDAFRRLEGRPCSLLVYLDHAFAMIVILCKSGMTVAEAARVLGEWPHRLWRALIPVVEETLDLSKTQVLCLDETSTRKGHNYITVASDPRAVSLPGKDGGTRYRTRVVAVTEGRDSKAVGEVKDFLAGHGCAAEQIQTVVKDMSPAYEKGVSEHFPKAERVVDFFHVVRWVGEAYDRVRKREHRQHPALFKDSLWAWRKREDNLSHEEAALRSRLLKKRHLQTGRACMILEAFREIFLIPDLKELEEQLLVWYRWARRSRIPEMKKAALTVKDHLKELLAFARTRLSNAAAEALNGLIQTAKRKARGYGLLRHFRAIIFLLAGNLQFNLPSPFPSPELNPQ